MDAHKTEPWEKVKNLPLLTLQGQDRDEGEEELTTELCRTHGIDKIQGDNTDKALKAAIVHKSSKSKVEREEVVVPVFATLLVKKIAEDRTGT